MTVKKLVAEVEMGMPFASANPSALPALQDTAALTVHPMDLMAVRSDPFVLRNGFPYVPKMWVNANTLVSGDGSHFMGERDQPFDVDIPMHTRFIASEGTWDKMAYKWIPASTQGIDYSFEGAPTTSPSVDTEISYRIGNKWVYELPVLSFYPGQFLISKFNDDIDDAVQYSVGMVVILNTEGPYGLWSGPPENNRLEVVLDSANVNLKFSANGITSKTAEKQPVGQRIVRPVYVVMTVGPDTVTLYTGTSPKDKRSYAVRAKAQPTQMRFRIGMDWTQGAVDRPAVASMHVLEWGLFDYELTAKSDPLSIDELYAAWSAIYGATDE